MADQTAHNIRIETPKRKIQPDVWRGVLAGLMGGIAGSAAKLLVEKIIPPRPEGQKAPPVVLAERVTGHALARREKETVKQGIHWSFGPLIGAAYGAAVEFEPELAARHGAAFGLALNGFTYKNLLPMLGLAEPVKDQPKQERFSEAASHVVYGVVTETVRRMIRGR
jgi:putative membrane protein